MPVVGWEGFYEVSDLGRVRSLPRLVRSRWKGYLRPAGGVVLAPRLNSNGYQQVHLSREGTQAPRLVHRLVLEAFMGPCPSGSEGCHGSGGKGDNSLQNLRWDTSRENSLDTVRHGTNRNASKTSCINGHPFDQANTYYANGKRGCKACRKANSAAHYRRTKEKTT
ncbi:MAG: NUMOD4 motif-containing HNH endonuclease [Mycobacteriaceae bacterium]